MSVYLQDTDVTIHCGDVLDVLPVLPEASVDCVVCSPPYWGLRDYQVDGQLGLEQSFDVFVDQLVRVFREVRRVLAPHGTCWVNLGDSYSTGAFTRQGKPRNVPQAPQGYAGQKWTQDRSEAFAPMPSAGLAEAGLKPKDLLGQPWAVAFALRADGWYLRSCVIWAKPNPMPESVTDRPTTSHEYVFLLAKGQWKARVVSLTNLDGNRVHLGDDLRPENANTWANEFAVRFATSILDSSELQNQLGLSPLDPEVRQKLADSGDSLGVAGLPVEHRAAVYAARLLTANATPKEFLCQLDGLGIALSENNKFLVLGGTTEFALPPGVDRYGETAVAIHHPGQIGELDFSAHTLKFSRPGGCSYFYDADAVREPAVWERWGDQTIVKEQPGKASWITPKGKNELSPDRRRAGFNERWNQSEANGTVRDSRNLRSVWTIPTQPYPEAHFATYPEELVRRCLLAGCPERVCRTCGKPSERIVDVTYGKSPAHGEGSVMRGRGEPKDVNSWAGESMPRVQKNTETVGFTDCGHNDYRPGIVLDPFLGSGTTAHVARKHGRKAVGIELNPDYCELASKRLAQQSLLAEPAA